MTNFDLDLSLDRQRLSLLGQARRRLGLALAMSPTLAAPAAAAASAAAASTAAARPKDDAAGPGDFTGRWVHAFAAYGAPKYGPDFSHFEYVNPQAPKGGTLKLKNPDRRSSFDKFNPWTTRGQPPAGILIWMVESCAYLVQDEPMTMYALLAEALLVAPDFSSLTVRLNPKARFHNGDPVTAEDVAHSFRMISGKGAQPYYQTLVAGIEGVVVVDERTARFVLRDKTREQVFVAGTMPVFSRKWGGGKPLDQIVMDVPIVSGPYVVDRFELPRRVEFKRDPNYWARDLPVRRGFFNFDRVVYRMYTDDFVALEAFKAGEFDLIKEYRSRSFVRLHAGVKWDDGRIRKEALPTRYGQAMQSFQLNNRLPKFQDARVREALALTYDFEFVNKTRAFTRHSSMFSNSDFAAQGVPSAEELALLEPFRAELPPRVFGPAFVSPRTDDVPGGLRRNLRRARDLLAEAGWKLDGEGKLRNAKGEQLSVEYMEVRTSDREAWRSNCQKLGIEFRQRIVDFALYRRRLEQYDFEMVTIVEGRFTLPQVNQLQSIYGSKAADEQGNSNYRGVKSRAVDALLERMAKASTLDELRTVSRALDRVVMWNWYQIPDLYSGKETISYWDKFGRPKVMAHYFQADTLIYGFTLDHGPWPLWTWWDKSLDATSGTKGA